MKLPEPLVEGRLVKRYKRFLADMDLNNGRRVTVHCPNPGSMKGLARTGNAALLSESRNPKRKLPLTWELVKIDRSWVGVNTLNANRLVDEALRARQFPELASYAHVQKEVTWAKGCRFDFLLADGSDRCFVEVKNVTLADNQVAFFPDAVTERGTKHLRHLMEVIRQGDLAVMLFLVGRADCDIFRPAEAIDPAYARTLREAHQKGVQVLVYRTKIDPPLLNLDVRLDYELA